MWNEEQLKSELSKLMHELIQMNQDIMEQGDYSNLLRLCKQDITILALLDQKQDITAKEISQLLTVPKTTIVSAVTRLVKRGYIERSQNEVDRREMILKLTAKGRMANQEHYDYEYAIIEALTCRWEQSDHPLLVELLMRRKEYK